MMHNLCSAIQNTCHKPDSKVGGTESEFRFRIQIRNSSFKFKVVNCTVNILSTVHWTIHVNIRITHYEIELHH